MRIKRLKSLRGHWVRTVAITALCGLAAGCSADASRFNDGFYASAVPQSGTVQTASTQGYGGGVDNMNTGSINGRGLPQYPGASGGSNASYASAPTNNVQSSQLPPPPSASSSYPSASRTPYAEPQASRQASLESPRADSAGVTRGAPPTSLQAQAARMSVPSERPERSASSSSRSSGSKTSVTVESGDTLLGIAHRTGVSMSAIKQANGMTGDTVRLGQTLIIPAGGKAGDSSESRRYASLDSSSEKPASRSTAEKGPASYTPPQAEEKQSKPETTNAAESDRGARPQATVSSSGGAPATTVTKEVEQQEASIAPKSTGISRFRWPAQGRVVSRFGEKVGSRRNDGLNISVPRGTAVKAAENGVVIYAGNGLKEFGKTVLIKHDDGLVTVYGNADDLEVQRGQKVTRGQEIAKSGMTGDTSIPIVHFEVRKNSTPVDPTTYLQ